MTLNSFRIEGFPADVSEAEVFEYIKPHGSILHLVLPEPGVVRVEFAVTERAEALLLAAKTSPLTFKDSPLIVTPVVSTLLTNIIHFRGREKSISCEDIDRVLLQRVSLVKYLLLSTENDFDLYVEFDEESSAIAFVKDFDLEELHTEFGNPAVGYSVLNDLFDIQSTSLQTSIHVTNLYIDESEELAAAAASAAAAAVAAEPAQLVLSKQGVNSRRTAKWDNFVNGTLMIMRTAREQATVVQAFLSNQATGVVLYGKAGIGKRVKILVDGSDVRHLYRRARDLNPDKLRDLFRIVANQEEPTLLVILDVMNMEASATSALIRHTQAMSSERNLVWVVGLTSDVAVVESEFAKKFTLLFLAELTD